MNTNRRAFLGTMGAGLLSPRLLAAQTAPPAGGGGQKIPVRKAKTTPLFKSPEGYPNAIAATADGLWIAEQKTDNAHLVDWNGKVLKTVKTESKNTSGMGVGGGYIWMGANAAPRETRVVSSSMPQSGQRVAKRSVPQIRLRGAWLERIGFVRGARFLVLVEQGQILLAIISS